jgi:flagellin FlaB
VDRILNRIKSGTGQWSRSERGVTGVETAIILIAFVVVASGFSFAVLSTGLTITDKSKDSIQAGISRTRGALELRGAVIAEDTNSNGNVDKVYFQVVNVAGGVPIELTPGQMVIRYSDASQVVMFDTLAKFSVTPRGAADNDQFLELGEVYELALLNMETHLATMLTNSKPFTIEVMPPGGIVLPIERNTPLAIARYNDLS